MKIEKLLLILLFSINTSIFYSQNEIDSTSVTHNNLKNSLNSTQAVNEKIEFKNGNNTSIITITDEGSNNGSITLPSMSSHPTSSTNKLYNVGGILKFNGSDIGNSGGSSGGWTDAGAKIYTSTITDNVGIGTTNPLSPLSVGGPGSADIGIAGVSPTDTGIGIFGTSGAGIGVSSFTAVGTGIQGEVVIGTAVKGIVNESSIIGNKAGFFDLRNGSGYAVHGSASGLGLFKNYGGFFEAKGDSGIGIYSIASSTHETIRTYGGYFEANSNRGRGIYATSTGLNGRGVIGEATGDNSRGVFGRTSGISAHGVYGLASDPGASSQNYGGYFEAAGGKGYGVYGHASNKDVDPNSSKTYGGYFLSESPVGTGVFGHASSTNIYNNDYSYGGHFIAEDGFGVYGQTNGTVAELAGVYGISTNTDAIFTYGGYFVSNGTHGKGVYGVADGPNAVGVFGASDGEDGIGVFGRGSGTNGIGVKGYGSVAGTSYDFDAQGPGVNYGATSSIRWKRNIVEIDDPLEKLSRLRGVYFDWDEEHGGAKDIGCIAEEVGKVLPEIVVYEENGIDADGMDYSKLTPLLIEVAKAQQEIIQQLTERITRLENK